MSAVSASAGELLAVGNAALGAGHWAEARSAFESCLSDGATPEASFGLAVALWWLGENHGSVVRCSEAYSLFRQSGDTESAVQCAVWLGITYKANFANFAAANGWIGRADRLLESIASGPLHGWAWVARAYRMPDLKAAEDITARALEVGRDAGDVDLELVALAQLGLIRVGRGETEAGFALIDEAVAAALAGERTSLDTVVYACCDMLNACELVSDLERAVQWCKVAADFVDSYGCPFLYAECRIYYGSVLAAKGRWSDAERELGLGLRITEGACPGLYGRALTRLAALRIRQGRLEEAEQLMSTPEQGVDVEAEATVLLAALQLARGDAEAAGRTLKQRLHQLEHHNSHLIAALDLLIEAYVAVGDANAAEATADRLTRVVVSADSDQVDALTASARGRVAFAQGDSATAVVHLEAALKRWSRLECPFEVARARFDLSRALVDAHPELALDHARSALASFESLGANLDADRVAAFLRSLGHSTRAGRKGVGTLTARELEVLRLLGVGLSNPEIAARLYVSRKTAAHHVSSVLTKLSLRNRAEAAAYAVRVLGPPEPPMPSQPAGRRAWDGK